MLSKDKYTDPKLRDQVKQEIQDSDKGGAPGQWSARKAQMMASEYKKRGGDYNTDKSEKDDSQKNLDKWGDEEWQTKEGSGNAKKTDGTEKRYLPKKAWDKMTEEEKEATDSKKQKESKEGKQHVANTGKAKDSRKKASQSGQTGKANGQRRNGRTKKGDDDGEDDDDAADEDSDEDDEAGIEEDEDANSDGDDEDPANGEGDKDHEGEEDNGNDEKASAGQKRSKQSEGSSKKQKSNSGEGKQNGTVGSKHQSAEEPAPRGSKDRLPKQGQQIHWKAMPGYVDGEVVEILTQGKDVDGKAVKASKSDPKLVLKSSSSGKICIHKPDACFFE